MNHSLSSGRGRAQLSRGYSGFLQWTVGVGCPAGSLAAGWRRAGAPPCLHHTACSNALYFNAAERVMNVAAYQVI